MKTNKNIAQPERQRTSIVIEGIDTSTPDDLVKDGKCSELHNLRFKDSAWRPVHQHPIKTKIRLDEIFYNEEDGGIFPDTAKVVYHHPAAGEDTYIVETVKNGKYSYYSIKDTFSSPDDTQGALIATFDEEMKISHFGNVIFFTNSKGNLLPYVLTPISEDKIKYVFFEKPQPPMLVQKTQKWADRGVDEGGDPTHPDDGWVDVGNITKTISPTHYILDLAVDVEEDGKPVWPLSETKLHTFKETWNKKVKVALWRLGKADGTPLMPNYCTDDKYIGYWWGEIAYFACYRMADGTVLSPTPIAICCSEVLPPNSYNQEIKVYEDDYIYLTVDAVSQTEEGKWVANEVPIKKLLSPQMQYCICKATITIPDDIDRTLLKEVSIYSTRLNPIFSLSQTQETPIASLPKIDGLVDVYNEGTGRYDTDFTITKSTGLKSNYFADNKLPEQPFYLIKSIPIDEFFSDDREIKGTIDIDIDYYMLRDAVSKPLYAPNDFIHDITGDVTLEFNSMLHMGNCRTVLASPNSFIDVESPLTIDPDNPILPDMTKIVTASIISKLNISNIEYLSKIGDLWITKPKSRTWSMPSIYCVTYPDYRATSLSIWHRYSRENYQGDFLRYEYEAMYPLSPAPGNNVAYYYKSDNALKFAPLAYKMEFQLSTYPTTKDRNIVITKNKILVSSANNPFSWPFGNTYSVGSNNSKILALQSAAIEMTDSKFGEMPLYAFTEEGIFALQAGESTLYSSVIPINYDRIINPNVLAINYNLAYITEKGLHLLNGNGSTLISQPLDTIDGSPLDMWSKVKLLNPQSFNEIVCYDEESKQAYIFNLDYQYWCTRDMQGLLINNSESVLSDGTIFDITQEDNNPETPYRLETRPIKLGDLEFKRLETIIPRMRVTSTTDKIYNKFKATLYVDAAYQPMYKSEDEKCYPILRFEEMRKLAFPDNDTRGIVIRRTPYSAQYFRMRFYTDEAETSEIALSNIDVEWYHKFLRKMR